ncbi:MAG: HD-GYP domain-containing protein [Bacillota bacterium]
MENIYYSKELYQIDLSKMIKSYKNKLDYRIDFEHEMNKITRSLSADQHVDLDKILFRLGKMVEVDRIYIFEFSKDLKNMNNTYEWCSEGTLPQIDNLKNIKSNIYPWWMKKLKNNEEIIISDINNIPEEGKKEKEILQQQSIKSVLVIPLYTDRLKGFMGFDDVKRTRIWAREDVEILKAAGDMITVYWDRQSKEKEILRINEKLSETVKSIIYSLSNINNSRDPYTKKHAQNVSLLSREIGKKMGFNKQEIAVLKTGALLHDIGKLSIPMSILFKPGELTGLEQEIVKQHSQLGYNIIKDIKFSDKIKKIVLQHHERLDGSGYPNNLKEKDIIIEAQIVAVADVFESMIYHRAYRPAFSIPEVIKIIKEDRGRLLNVEAVEACIDIIEKEGREFFEQITI